MKIEWKKNEIISVLLHKQKKQAHNTMQSLLLERWLFKIINSQITTQQPDACIKHKLHSYS